MIKFKRPIIEVDNMANFEFWLAMFKPRKKNGNEQP